MLQVIQRDITENLNVKKLLLWKDEWSGNEGDASEDFELQDHPKTGSAVSD